MPKYYGCPCEGCGKPLTLQDDIVVCPDCGAPYHRVCYEKLGQCIHRPAHAAGYEWKFPYEESQRAALREEANTAIAAELKKRASDTLDKVLFELSSGMKNAYARSDA